MANTNVSLYNRIPAFPQQGNLWGLRPVEEQRVSACTSLCSLPPPPRSAHRHARELRLPQETRQMLGPKAWIHVSRRRAVQRARQHRLFTILDHEKSRGLLWRFTCLQSLPALALNKPSSSSSSPPVGGGGRRRGGLEEACCRKTSWPTPSLAKGSTRRQSRCSARCIWWSSGCSGRGGFTQR